ncbi:tautomerase family protein [candidate division WOR-3 bacterium]|nr:tautomerase family protein [candidate division WOR-3 bacterium]
MPHVIIKMYPGRSDEQKSKLTEAVTRSVVDIAKTSEEHVSIDIQEINPEDWAETVYRKEILPKLDELAKKPGYNPFT